MKKALYWFLGLSVGLLAIGLIAGPAPSPAAQGRVAEASEAAVEQAISPVVEVEDGPVQFSYTAEVFARQLAAASSKLVGKDVRPPKINVQKSDVADHFEVKVRPDVSVWGFLNNETRHMTKASITIASGYSDVNTAMLVGMLMMAVSPESTAEERGSAFKSLTSGAPSAVLGNARYTLGVVDGSTVLTATPYSAVGKGS